MKKRNGFVSNSSSSSFIIAFKGESFEKVFDEEFKTEKSMLFPKLLEETKKCFKLSKKEEYTSALELAKSIDDLYIDDDFAEKLIKKVSSGHIVFTGSISDETREPIEYFLCNQEINYESENLFIYKEESY